MNSKTEKKIKVEFAPGCFDSFEGTQEELDAFMKEITDMFANMTPEELKKRSIDLEVDDELFQKIAEKETRRLQ